MINVEKSSLFFLFQFFYNSFLFSQNKSHDVCTSVLLRGCAVCLCCLWEIENYGFSFGN